MTRDVVAVWVETLRMERLRLKMRQQDVADKMGVNRTMIAYWENGRTQPLTANMAAWAAALGFEVTMSRVRVPKVDE